MDMLLALMEEIKALTSAELLDRESTDVTVATGSSWNETVDGKV